MTDTNLSTQGEAMLRNIARPNVSGVPGAVGSADIGELLANGLVTFGCDPNYAPVPSGEDAWKKPMAITQGQMWVKLSDAGRAWLDANPSEADA
jgi:hypothetical protein